MGAVDDFLNMPLADVPRIDVVRVEVYALLGDAVERIDEEPDVARDLICAAISLLRTTEPGHAPVTLEDFIARTTE